MVKQKSNTGRIIVKKIVWMLYVGLLFCTHVVQSVMLSELLRPSSRERLQELLHDKRHASVRIKLAEWIWKQENCVQLWEIAAALYGGYSELSKQYVADSRQNMLNCAIARGQDDVVRLLSPHAVARL